MSAPHDALPTHLDPPSVARFKAKSMARSHGTQQDTLALHTWQVLRRLADQHRLFPRLAEVVGQPRLWHQLFWGCFLHDFGKAAHGFQERLSARPGAQKNDWAEGHHRHEVLSLAFVSWLFPRGHQDRLGVLGVIATHHRDVLHDDLTKYGFGGDDSAQRERVAFLASQLSDADVDALWAWLADYGERWRTAPELGLADATFPAAPSQRDAFGAQAIHDALADLDAAMVGWQDGYEETHILLTAVLGRGLILASDHAASAGAGRYPALAPLGTLARRAFGPHQPRTFQRNVAGATSDNHLMLVAPTGSGKTEAALLWASQQAERRSTQRLFYVLPYQASMNAMADRLARRACGYDGGLMDADNDQVTVLHARALLKTYRDLMDADSGADDTTHQRAAAQARNVVNVARLNYYPVQVLSPYQLLKCVFRLRGYEALLLNTADALFVLDEMHAYDAARTGLFVAMLQWLARNMGARFLIMTATMPPMLADALAEALPGLRRQEADAATYAASRRHHVRLRDGTVGEAVDEIVARYADGQSVLVVCNTVARAQQTHSALADALAAANTDADTPLLLHGRFNLRDRNDKEGAIRARAGVGAASRKPTLLVATQVVEVSLDVDFDVLYSEPAPLEALLQRFGRVNRARGGALGRPPADLGAPNVFVFREPVGEKEALPYDHMLVARGLGVLAQHDGTVIDERLVNTMLAEVYDEARRAAWRKLYDEKFNDATNLLYNMKPYQSADQSLAESYYRLFDGVDVLPAALGDEYETAIAERRTLGAIALLVNISFGRLCGLKGQGVATRYDDDVLYLVHKPYTPDCGLSFDEDDNA